MNKELVELIHNECTPQQRLRLMEEIASNPGLAREYSELVEMDARLRGMFAEVSGPGESRGRMKKPRILQAALVAANIAAAACIALLLHAALRPAPGADGRPAQPTAAALPSDAPRPPDPFADTRRRVASQRRPLSASEAAMARQLASASFNDTLEIQSRASAREKIKEIISAPYIPKIGRDFKPQSTNREAVEMLLADKPEGGEILFGFAPNLY